MSAIVKSLIVWLVLLAVPFQGYASAAMLGCAPVKAARGDTHAHHAAAKAGMDHAHHGSPHADADEEAGASGHTCSNCAVCSVAAAIAPTIAAVSQHAPPTLTIPFDDGPIPTVDLAHPKRPPRFARA